MPSRPKSILLIGATGPTGEQVMKQLLAHPSRQENPTNPQVHVFCRDPTKVPSEYVDAITSIQKGDARKSTDLSRALVSTKATHVVVCIGSGSDLGKSDIRTASASALAKSLHTTDVQDDVQVVVLSSSGAGNSRIKVGMGIGRLIEYHLRNVLVDHTGQEAVFLGDEDLIDRTWIVRPTGLTNDKPSPGRVVTFGDAEKAPTTSVDRADVATYIVDRICKRDGSVGGHIDNITTGKKQ